MKIRFLIITMLMVSAFFISLSNYVLLSVILSFFILPAMIYLSGKYKVFIFLLPFLWEVLLLYPVYIVFSCEYNAIIAFFYFLAMCFILALPVSIFIFTCLSKKYCFFAPFIYIFILYLFKAEIFQTLPPILIFQNEFMRKIAEGSFSSWMTTLSLLYLSISIFDILIKNKSGALCCLIVSFLFVFFPSRLHYNSNINSIKIAGVQLSLMMKDFTVLEEIMNFTDEMIRNDPDIKMVVYSESPWLGFKNYNNASFTKKLLSYFIKRSLIDGVIYVFQMDSIDFNNERINKVLTVKIENGRIWYSGKSHLVPGWERGRGVNDNYFIPELNKKIFTVSERKFNALVCYDSLFMPSLFERDYDVVLVQSNYSIFKEKAGKNAYEHMVKISNILSWFSNASNGKSYMNIQNDGGSDFINSHGVRKYDFYDKSLLAKSLIINIR